jgi:hypothetical protein
MKYDDFVKFSSFDFVIPLCKPSKSMTYVWFENIIQVWSISYLKNFYCFITPNSKLTSWMEILIASLKKVWNIFQKKSHDTMKNCICRNTWKRPNLPMLHIINNEKAPPTFRSWHVRLVTSWDLNVIKYIIDFMEGCRNPIMQSSKSLI